MTSTYIQIQWNCGRPDRRPRLWDLRKLRKKIITSDSAIAERAHCRLRQFWPKVWTRYFADNI